jgi:2-phosphosulfolactate phosphatase
VLRATSSIVTALARGAEAVAPASTIAEAVGLRSRQPEALLAGERDGVRIPASLAGGVSFDLGNSPREFTPQAVGGRVVVMTTTNGTRALRASATARRVLVAAFLNLEATANLLRRTNPAHLLLVCSGTGEEPAYEDILAAGALCDLVWSGRDAGEIADSALAARRLFLLEPDLASAIRSSRNARRLLGQAELREDVAYCSQRDVFNLVAELGPDGKVRVATDPG